MPGWAERVRSAQIVQTSTCSVISRTSSTSMPRNRTVRSIFVWPGQCPIPRFGDGVLSQSLSFLEGNWGSGIRASGAAVVDCGTSRCRRTRRPTPHRASVHLGRCAFGLERGEEALHRRVLPDVSGPQQRALNAMLGHQTLTLLARILAAVIGVMHEFALPAPAPHSHHERVVDQFRHHRRAHRPAHQPARVEFEHDRSV